MPNIQAARRENMISPAVRIVNHFWPEHKSLFSSLCETVAWDERMRARKTASFGAAYNYSQIFYPNVPMHQSLEAVCRALTKEIGFTPNNCLLNYYVDGRSAMGFHADKTDDLEPETGVAILSLGAARTIRYRHSRKRDVTFDYSLTSGDLLYMSDDVQNSWLHAIPKDPEAGARISATFRKLRGHRKSAN